MASSLFIVLLFLSCGLIVVPPIHVLIVPPFCALVVPSCHVLIIWSLRVVVRRSFMLVWGRSCCLGGQLHCVGCRWHWAHVEGATSPSGEVAVVIVSLGVVIVSLGGCGMVIKSLGGSLSGGLVVVSSSHGGGSVAAAPVQSQLKPGAEPSLAEAQPELPSDGSHISAISGSG